MNARERLRAQAIACEQIDESRSQQAFAAVRAKIASGERRSKAVAWNAVALWCVSAVLAMQYRLISFRISPAARPYRIVAFDKKYYAVDFPHAIDPNKPYTDQQYLIAILLGASLLTACIATVLALRRSRFWQRRKIAREITRTRADLASAQRASTG